MSAGTYMSSTDQKKLTNTFLALVTDQEKGVMELMFMKYHQFDLSYRQVRIKCGEALNY